MSDLDILAAMRMRMLRLSEGWSAEKLSQEYAARGAGVLTRTTIAKIEAAKRKIKASETAGVASVFDLTSADLLNADGPDVFLSFAEEDVLEGQKVSAWLSERGFRLVPDRGPGAAHAFVLLFSPRFLSSSRCREELGLAMRHKEQLLAAGLPASFIYGLRLAEGAGLDESGLSADELIDLPVVDDTSAGGRPREAALSKLGASVIFSSSRARALVGRVTPPALAEASDEPLGRGEELKRVLNALDSPSGDHFWLIVGPPGIGKSWLLERLEAEAAGLASGSWVTSLVDLRGDETAGPETAERQSDAMKVVRRLFAPEQPQQPADPEKELRGIAQKIIQSGQPRLCLLDSAESLAQGTVAELRRHLGKIYTLIQDLGGTGARLALVTASRRDDGWGGVTPYPRVSILPLAEFGKRAIQDALRKLALVMPGVVRSPAELRRDAGLVQRATEGLPELVGDSLRWIEAEAWLEIERVNDEEFFADVVKPYVGERLLGQDSLLPGSKGQLEKQLTFMKDALRTLAPYRFVTRSHVRYHLDSDCSFSAAMKEANWDLDDLWLAIGSLALLRRPLDEPWHEIHLAIRRLLDRYFYTQAELAEAHASARDFTRGWAGQLSGKDQVTGVVESIWHEAVRLKLTDYAAIATELPVFSQSLSRDLRESTYTTDELRDYAVQRIAGDAEFQREFGEIEGLFDTLSGAIKAPEPGDMI